MTYPTRNAALASLREYIPELRKAHQIVRVYSEKYGAYRYGRVLVGQPAKI